MKQLEKAIAKEAFILDNLRLLQQILDSGDCNVCVKKNECKYAPKLGEMVRYNCPFYEKK